MSQVLEYNEKKAPCNWQIALDHAKASLPASEPQSNQVCPCCLIHIHQQGFPVNFSLKSISKLGLQYRFFFQIMKIIGLLLMGFFFTNSLILLFDAVNLQESSNELQLNLYYLSTLQPHFPNFKLYLISMIGWMTMTVSLIIMKVLMNQKITQEYRKEKVGQHEYSVLMSNIPKSQNIQENIKNLIQSNIVDVEVKKIILIQKMDKYRQGMRQVDRQVMEWKKVLKDESKNHTDMLACLKNIQFKKKELQVMKLLIRASKQEYFSEKAIVILKTKRMKNKLLSEYKTIFNKNKLSVSFGKIETCEKQVVIQEIGRVQEIHWQNIQMKGTKNMLVSVLMLGILGIFFVFYLVCQYMTGRAKNQPQVNKSISVILLSILNLTLLPYLVSKVQNHCYSPSQTQYNIGMVNKLCVLLILIKSFVVIGTQAVFYQSTSIGIASIDKLTIVFVVQAILIPIYWLIHPMHIGKQIISKLTHKYANRRSITQQQANKMMENPIYYLHRRYAFVVVLFWTSFMFSDIIPLGLLLSPLCLFAFYWIDKCNISKRSSINTKPTNKELSLHVLLLLQYGIVFKPIMNIVFGLIIRKYFNIVEAVMLLLSVVYILCRHKLYNIIITIYIDGHNLSDDKLGNGQVGVQWQQQAVGYDDNGFDYLYQLQYPLYYKYMNSFEHKRKLHNIQIKNYDSNDSRIQQKQTERNLSNNMEDMENKGNMDNDKI